MNFDGYDFDNLVDEGKRLVIEELKSQLMSWHDGSICVCNDCVVDMAALALNLLPPRYHSSLLGTIYLAEGANEPEYAEKLKKTVKDAIDHVSRHPGHEIGSR
ncbi:MAG: late competence development ComFB family protein [Spirochaetaceae bacterium]|jgi:competence protein ComFB|nr:late competence development ComFB family protein [Spirochaetaceae bacterium]